MQVATGTVVNGKIVVEGASLPDGTVVTVLSRSAAESFSLSEAQENELLDAIAEIGRSEFETLDSLIASLPKKPWVWCFGSGSPPGQQVRFVGSLKR
jgi:hypothetical protein